VGDQARVLVISAEFLPAQQPNAVPIKFLTSAVHQHGRGEVVETMVAWSEYFAAWQLRFQILPLIVFADMHHSWQLQNANATQAGMVADRLLVRHAHLLAVPDARVRSVAVVCPCHCAQLQPLFS
jgi:hypothetical protein